MKKLFAFLVLLMLALGNVNARAEQGTRVRLTVSFPPDWNVRSTSLLRVLDGSPLNLSILPDDIDLSLATGENPTCLLRVAADGDGAALYSDLTPSYVLRVRIPPSSPSADPPPAESPQQKAQTEDRIQQLMALSRPYVQQIADFIAQVQKTTAFSEDYSVMTMELTTDLLNGLLDTLADGLRADAALADRLNVSLQRINPFLPQGRKLSAQEIQDTLADRLQALRVPGNQIYATLRTRSGQDGTGTLEIRAPRDTVMTYEASPGSNAVAVWAGEHQLLSGQIEKAVPDLPAPSIPSDGKILELNDLGVVNIQRLLLDAQLYGIPALTGTGK
ncbi:MAG: hypothetical protein IJ214_01985 [Clostridia bacterium]|nr:hypothetical protein [Clostridia bacterium]